MVGAAIPIDRPSIELIRAGRGVDIVLIVAIQDGLLIRVNCKRTAIECKLALARPNSDICLNLIRVGIDTVLTGSSDGEGQVHRIDLEIFARLNLPDPNTHTSFRKPDLSVPAVQV
jgi:hypothetical protein